MPDHHVVLSYGDVFRQSGYRTKVLGELLEYEKGGPLTPVLIAFDRDSDQLAKTDLGGVAVYAHSRRNVLRYYSDIRRLSRTGRIRIVHAHNLYSGALALSARWLYGYKVLVELHGRIPEEYVILGKGGRFWGWVLRHLESWVIQNADHIVPISVKLNEYLVEQYRLTPSRLTVIPDCADPRVFHWNPELRKATRARMNLDDQFVCVHLGSVFVWYDPDLIVKVFRRIKDQLPSAHLLVVTEDSTRTRDYLKEKLPPEAFTVLGVPHCEVPALLAASDLGFLLLRSTPNIQVSSPAKFSEYVNSGLPVLITPQVGDFSSMVALNGIGAIVTDDGQFDITVVDAILRSRDAFARRAMDAGKQLSWETWRLAWTTAIESLM
jgi:glycosyltransferase involved in cell wall biosynthesis